MFVCSFVCCDFVRKDFSNGKHIDSTGASVVGIKEKLEVWTIVCSCWEDVYFFLYGVE